MPNDTPISRTISLRESEWELLEDNRKALGMTRTEYIRTLLNCEKDDGMDGYDQSIHDRIEIMEREMKAIKDILEHKAETTRQKNNNKDIKAVAREQMLPVDRLINDIETGIVTAYDPTALSKDYGLETTVIRNAWRKATGETPW